MILFQLFLRHSHKEGKFEPYYFSSRFSMPNNSDFESHHD
jgi:hypothetical protein